jgi:uncharacterized membrane protein
MVNKTEIENGKICALLAYLLFGIIWYFADEKMKKNNFAKFHTKQGIILIITSILGSVILGIIPVLGWIVYPIFQLGILIFAILGIINSLNGKEKELPVIGQFAKKLNF